MDGLTATRQIRLHPQFKNLPIIALSAEAFLKQQKEALKAGITDYLTKPIDLKKLLVVLDKYLKKEILSVEETLSTLQPMPSLIHRQVIEKLHALIEVPIFLSDQIIQHVREIQTLCRGYENSFTSLLKEIESAVFSRNAKQVPLLIKKVLADL